ncbi:nucleotidyltransferase domain-containing protein [Paenibacillus antri]|uniref:Nucleotidyltransferase domain-containing protein n=1 Tax=Paenibacillus antri TaxID=2582848 RepID=A0A5R9GF14_9BACL|nr:nucleotidyltransferase domain-containing protein [Paenibacillus antri]TLS52720.1 nucleotidyltransferase domain-containing protein [Paenibacillus antri]
MRERIASQLDSIEKAHELKVLFAVESGSRAWGFPSVDSDYDVRFVYVKRPAWYLSIDEKRDVVEVPINDMLDINGWDLRKALRLFRKSNPPLMEWLTSELVYADNLGFRDELLRLRNRVFSPKASMHHYLSMAKRNFREYLQGDQVKIKKYFYVLRPVLACLWIEKYDTVPPIRFQTLAEDLLPASPLKREVEQLLRRKLAGEEMGLENRLDAINAFVEAELERLLESASVYATTGEDPTPLLDDVFRKFLGAAWKS